MDTVLEQLSELIKVVTDLRSMVAGNERGDKDKLAVPKVTHKAVKQIKSRYVSDDELKEVDTPPARKRSRGGPASDGSKDQEDKDWDSPRRSARGTAAEHGTISNVPVSTSTGRVRVKPPPGAKLVSHLDVIRADVANACRVAQLSKHESGRLVGIVDRLGKKLGDLAADNVRAIGNWDHWQIDARDIKKYLRCVREEFYEFYPEDPAPIYIEAEEGEAQVGLFSKGKKRAAQSSSDNEQEDAVVVSEEEIVKVDGWLYCGIRGCKAYFSQPNVSFGLIRWHSCCYCCFRAFSHFHLF